MNEKIERKVLQFEGFARANASTFDTEDTIAFKVNRYRKMIEATGFGTQTKAEAFLAKAQEALRNNEDVELIRHYARKALKLDPYDSEIVDFRASLEDEETQIDLYRSYRKRLEQRMRDGGAFAPGSDPTSYFDATKLAGCLERLFFLLNRRHDEADTKEIVTTAEYLFGSSSDLSRRLHLKFFACQEDEIAFGKSVEAYGGQPPFETSFYQAYLQFRHGQRQRSALSIKRLLSDHHPVIRNIDELKSYLEKVVENPSLGMFDAGLLRNFDFLVDNKEFADFFFFLLES